MQECSNLWIIHNKPATTPGIESKVKPLQTFNPESPEAVPETESSNDPRLLSAPVTETASAPKLKLVASAERKPVHCKRIEDMPARGIASPSELNIVSHPEAEFVSPSESDTNARSRM